MHSEGRVPRIGRRDWTSLKMNLGEKARRSHFSFIPKHRLRFPLAQGAITSSLFRAKIRLSHPMQGMLRPVRTPVLTLAFLHRIIRAKIKSNSLDTVRLQTQLLHAV